VKVFRAVPKILSYQDKIKDLEAQKKYILKHGKIPPQERETAHTSNSSTYYDKIHDELEQLLQRHFPEQPPSPDDNHSSSSDKVTIYPGDWITVWRPYAVKHGQSALRGKYRILTKTVRAGDIFTNGDSIYEWGWQPS
jgi:hypothetical protein